ncbi:hotdog fold thioesterase [Geoglobus acetivorans]|uniref:Hotdog fold thioesterase n=1 Tax=Geoglobus acetivorans TaxID=565033 RepID=A0ABZ3H1K3_GEOAI|nr:hotdog fold thioesterase [Geoglobus acetivorans]
MTGKHPKPEPDRDSFRKFLNAEILEVRDGYARVEGVVSSNYLNFHGTAHGAYIMALADFAFALAVNSGNYSRFALSIRMDFIKPAFHGDRLTAEAEIEYGRKVAFCRLEVRRGDETIARGLAIAYGSEVPA